MERDAMGSFAWTGPSFRIRLRRNAQFAHLKLCYYGAWGTLAIQSSHGPDQQVPIHRGWHDCVLPLHAAQAGDELEWRVAPLMPVAGDTRNLGVMIREVELFDDPAFWSTISTTFTGKPVGSGSEVQTRPAMEMRSST